MGCGESVSRLPVLVLLRLSIWVIGIDPSAVASSDGTVSFNPASVFSSELILISGKFWVGEQVTLLNPTPVLF